jgi:hypothetical protein
MHESIRAVDKGFRARHHTIYTHLPLERAFCDVHVAVQHGTALPRHFESGGKALLRLRPGDPDWVTAPVWAARWMSRIALAGGP